MNNKARQQRANNKARKAKARAEHEAKFGSWIKRCNKRFEQKPILRPRGGMVLSLDAMETVISSWEQPEGIPND